MISQPWNQLVEAEPIGGIERGDESIGLLRIGREQRLVDKKKRIRGGESCPFVAIEKGMVLREAFPKRRCFLDQIGVVTGLRPVKSGLQQPSIPNSMEPPYRSIWSACMARTSITVR